MLKKLRNPPHIHAHLKQIEMLTDPLVKGAVFAGCKWFTVEKAAYSPH